MRTIAITLSAAIVFLLLVAPDRGRSQAEVLPPPAAIESAKLLSLVENHSSDIAAIKSRLNALESQAAGLSVKVSAAPVVKSSTVSAGVAGRWRNYDGLTPRAHAVEVHGFDSSLSDKQLAALHDAWHDANGGDPPAAMRSRSVSVARASNDCPGGVCPVRSRSTVVSSRGGLLGFGVLGRR